MDISSFLKFIKDSGERYYKLSSECARKCGLTKPQADVLLFLSNNNGLDTASDIVKYRGFSKAYVSKAVEGLNKKKLIAIQEDIRDRRTKRLTINEKAGDIVSELHSMQKQFLADITIPLTAEERANLETLIAKLINNS